jgi:hypothetical protein
MKSASEGMAKFGESSIHRNFHKKIRASRGEQAKS